MKEGVLMGKNMLIAMLLILVLSAFVSAGIMDWFKDTGLQLSPHAKAATSKTAAVTCIDSDSDNSALAGVVKPKNWKTIYADKIISAGGPGNPGRYTEMSCSKRGALAKKEVKCTQGVVEVSVEFEGFTLQAAQCKSEQPAASDVICTDSDGGADASIAGGTHASGSSVVQLIPDIDTCNGNQLREYSCDNGIVTSSIINCKGSDQGLCKSSDIVITMNGIEKTYSAGSCVPQTTSCIDTDDGDSSISGSASATDAVGKTTTLADRCVSSKKLSEAVCNSEGIPERQEITCDDLCNKGACVARDVKCQDTDSGLDIGVRGTVTNSLGASLTDSCVGESVLLEFSCASVSGGDAKPAATSKEHSRIISNYRKCDGVCTNGACISGKSKESSSGDELKNQAWCSAR